MATARKWSNIAIAMESARAASVSISGITKANPRSSPPAPRMATPPATMSRAHGQRHVSLNDRAARIIVLTGTTFSIEGVDSTSFDTFTSGGAEKLTFGTSITTATSVSSSGGGFDFIDTTTIHNNSKTQMPGLPAAASWQFHQHLGRRRRRPPGDEGGLRCAGEEGIQIHLRHRRPDPQLPSAMSAAACCPAVARSRW